MITIRKIHIYKGQTHLVARAGQKALHSYSAPWSRKRSLHDAAHERMDQCRRDLSPPLHLLQDLYTDIHFYQLLKLHFT